MKYKAIILLLFSICFTACALKQKPSLEKKIMAFCMKSNKFLEKQAVINKKLGSKQAFKIEFAPLMKKEEFKILCSPYIN